MHNHCICGNGICKFGLGCGITALYSTLIFTENIVFLENSYSSSTTVLKFAGAIWAFESSLHFNGTNNFIGNVNSAQSSSGGAIYATNDTFLRFTGSSDFNNNSAPFGSGAIYAERDTFAHFSGTNTFSNNSANKGGAICAERDTFAHFSGTNTFSNNSATNGGAIYTKYNVVFSFIGSNNFIGNSAQSFGDGGAISTTANTSMSFTGVNTFSDNSASIKGGVIDADSTTFSFSGTSNFNNNSAFIGGGVINAGSNTSLNFNGTSNFNNNSAVIVGGAIYTSDNVSMNFNGTSTFNNNSAIVGGGAIYTESNVQALVSFKGLSNFGGNVAKQGGAIFASDTTPIFEGKINFTNNGNQNSSGGGVHLSYNSTFLISPNTTVYWDNNHALSGGAIYVDDSANPFIYCTQVEKCAPNECFFQLPGQNLSSGLNVQLVFKNNSADDAGGVLYGGAVDNCRLTHGLDLYSSGEVFDMVVHIEDDNTTSSISSEPFRICQCENNLPNCRKSCVPKTVYPGETFTVSVVAVGQRNGTVAAEIISMTESDATLLSSQYTQQASNKCTTLNYTVFSLSDFVLLQLYANFPCSTFGYALNISLTINQTCPPGFKISESTRSCVCEQRLARYTNRCDVTSGKITRNLGQQFWVGYDDQSHGLILYPLCPFDYCVNHTVAFPLNDTDLQCAHNRSGLLCGGCKEGYSQVLGTSHCRKCTNSHLVLLIPFAVMGVALVFLLLVCKLTVATGILSGLVFYANIIGVNRTIFIPGESTDALSVFIAWLNLDFGIDSCFYDGLDAYTKTWLQFVFPLYLWMLVGFMIVISRFSDSFARLLGKNPFSVLATLILLSYAKILRTLITVIYFTYLEYPTYNKGVWLYDANIDYLSGKHIPLFITAVLVFIFLFLPYTLLLLFGQWLQAISHLRFFSWVNKLKPFMDSYHAPYKAKHRYWPGLLLVLRFVLFLVFAFNPQQDPSINLLAILVGAGMLHMWAWFSGGVYRNWCLDALEGSFMVNLTILVAATYHVNHSKGNQYAAGYTSVSIALITFIGILTYHIFQQLKHTKLCKKVSELNMDDNIKEFHQSKNENISESDSMNNPTVTYTDIAELREPLLEDDPPPNGYTA